MAENTPPPPSDDEPQIEERGISQVAGPSSQNNLIAGVFLTVIVVALLFFIWKSGDDDKTSTEVTTAQEQEFRTPRRVEAPVVPELQPEVEQSAQAQVGQQVADPYQIELRRLALRQAEEARKLAEQRRRSPILIVNSQARGAGEALRLGQGREALEGFAAGDTSTLAGVAGGVSQEEQFAARVATAQVETVRAGYIRSRTYMIAQGTLIRGVLETAVQSDLPGFVRAEVAHDVYSFDGSRLLIPKASRLVGQYKSGLVRGQSRLFVIWTRVLRPDGASILIGSPGTDLLGRAGVQGDLDTHFFKIFGASILLSVIDGAIAIAVEKARDSGNNSTTIFNNGASLSRAAEIALENSINIPPTIHIDQGTAIQIIVAKDLDFRNVEMR